MKQHFKTYLKFGILLLGISIFSISCQKEEITIHNSSLSNIGKPSFNFQKVGKVDIEKNRELNKKLNKLIEKQEANKSSNKTVYVSDYDFYINTDYATYIESADESYHSYTFQIDRVEETDTIENLVLTLREDGSYTPLLVKYNTTAQEKLDIINGVDIDLSNKISISLIDDLNLANAIFNKSTAPGDCTIPNYNIGPCDNGDTYVHDSEKYLNGGGMCTGSTSTLIGFNVDWDCMNNSSGGGINNPPNNNNQDGNPHSGPSNPNVVTSPKPSVEDAEEDGKKRECRKINRQLSKFPNLHQDLLNLKAQTSASIEHGIFIDDTATSTTSNPSQPIPQLPDGSMQPNTNPSSPYVMMAHTHNSPSVSTYSVPSWEDLTSIAELSLNGHIDVSEFVFYLFTADSTSYAITINDASDLAGFFLDTSDTNLNNPNDPNYNENRNKIYKLTRARVEYYYKKPPLIQENSTDYNQDLIHFLTLLKEADMGLSVFEIDSNITTFTEVTLNNTNDDIVPNNCN